MMQVNRNVGRNDPCPCGSGRKYKKCCLNDDRDKGELLSPVSISDSDVTASLQEKLKGRKFESREELQAFMDTAVQSQNQAPLECFDGLSPDIMHIFLHKPFDSPQFVTFPAHLDSEPSAPILTFFNFLVETVGEKGLKATAKGNLPRKVCQEAVSACLAEDDYLRHLRDPKIMQEREFPELHRTRSILETAGLLRLEGEKFILSGECRSLLAGSGLRAIYPRLFRTYIMKIDWTQDSYYAKIPLIQQSFLFTLYLLKRHGIHEQRQDFYEDTFLKAFPTVMDEADMKSESGLYCNHRERAVRTCYAWDVLHHFAKFFGLISLESIIPDSPLAFTYKVKKLPLLDEVVLFHF